MRSGRWVPTRAPERGVPTRARPSRLSHPPDGNDPRGSGESERQLTVHPDLEAEQAYIDHAYDCLDEARARANKLQSMVEVGRGGTEQARFERDVIWDTILHRLTQLHLGDASLC